ncbi:MAG: hypothetical protein AB7O28_11520 [Vicinamibacterales bacterium]
MRARAARRRLAEAAAIFLIAALAGACHVQTRVALPGEPPPAAGAAARVVKAGDDVVIELRDGTLAGLVVAEVRTDALVGTRGQRYPLADIVRIERRRVSLGRSAGLVAGVYLGLIAALTLLLLAAGWELA